MVEAAKQTALKPARGGGGLKDQELRALAKGVTGWLCPIIKGIEQRLAALEAENAALKARPTMSYRGIWTAEELYHLGDFVTDHGSLWHCSEASIGARPGSSSAWKLTVKRGGDGRK